jgi:hypothetical protein
MTANIFPFYVLFVGFVCTVFIFFLVFLFSRELIYIFLSMEPLYYLQKFFTKNINNTYIFLQ